MDMVMWFQVAGLSLASFLFGMLVMLFVRPSPAVQKAKAVELYVGNLAYDTNKKDLIRVFQRFGSVKAVRIIVKRINGQSKGYGFVEMADRKSADAAIGGLNGKEFNGRPIVVGDARTRSKGRRQG